MLPESPFAPIVSSSTRWAGGAPSSASLGSFSTSFRFLSSRPKTSSKNSFSVVLDLSSRSVPSTLSAFSGGKLHCVPAV